MKKWGNRSCDPIKLDTLPGSCSPKEDFLCMYVSMFITILITCKHSQIM